MSRSMRYAGCIVLSFFLHSMQCQHCHITVFSSVAHPYSSAVFMHLANDMLSMLHLSSPSLKKNHLQHLVSWLQFSCVVQFMHLYVFNYMYSCIVYNFCVSHFSRVLFGQYTHDSSLFSMSVGSSLDTPRSDLFKKR